MLIIMAALRSRCGHYIFVLWFLLSFFRSFFLSSFFSSRNLSRRRLHVYHTSTHDVALVQFKMHVWNMLHAARWNTGRKNHKKCLLGTIAQLCPAISSQLRHVSAIRPRSIVNFGPLTAEICWWVWGTPANFNRFRVLASLLHRRRSPAVNKTLQDVSPSPVLVHYICILGALALTEILPAAKFTLHPSLAFSYIDRITARHSTTGSQPIFVAMYKEWNYGTFADGATYIRLGGHHVGHRPIF